MSHSDIRHFYDSTNSEKHIPRLQIAVNLTVGMQMCYAP
jgi:hypothetical protein